MQDEANLRGLPVHRGGCHCGDVRFEVDGPIEDVVDCNCSICRKKGFLHWIVRPERFRLLTPASKLTTWTFGTGVARHTFCSRCGIHAFYTPRSHPDHTAAFTSLALRLARPFRRGLRWMLGLA